MAMLFNHKYSNEKERETFTIDKPASFVTFNSVIDNPEIGDERYNFVTVRKDGETEFKKYLKLDLGDRFTLRIFFHNNADVSLNGSGEGISKDTKFSYTCGAFCSDEDAWKKYGPDSNGIMVYIKSSNSTPRCVRDYCVIRTPDDIRISPQYIIGSARLINKTGVHQFVEETFRGLDIDDYGQLIGDDQMDGVVSAGESGYIELGFEVVV